MLKLLTDCSRCSYSKVCKDKGNAKRAMYKLRNTNYGTGPNDDYDWDIMSDYLNITIEFSCKDYNRGESPTTFIAK